MSESDDEFDAKKAVAEALELLDNTSTASFYALGKLGEINPGLSVDGVGSIGLPVSEHDAQRLISSSRQAPFGKGSQTLVDTSVRKTWEIDSNRIHLNHPRWAHQLQELVTDVAKQLGIARGDEVVRAELYKLLIYESGAMFKAHTDTEKANGMFGTLAMCLPCKHTGGDVEVTFRGKKKTLSTAVTSEWSVSYLAWYSDVLHEVKPVSSGYRIVLTFNLVQVGSTVFNGIANYDDRSDSLKSALMQWKHGSSPMFLIYPLEHQYTEHSLALNRLQGNDLARVQAVASLTEETEMVCYLGSVEKEVVGGVDDNGYDDYRYVDKHEIIDEISSKLVLSKGVALNGTQQFRDMPVEENDFVYDDTFDDEPDEEDFEQIYRDLENQYRIAAPEDDDPQEGSSANAGR